MIDIHHHLIWGVDDGAASLDTSFAMARMAAADGITHIVCTPHCNYQYEYQPEVIDERIEELRQMIHDEQLDLTLGRGSDFHLSYDNFIEVRNQPSRYSINGNGFLLAEIPDVGLSPGLAEVFFHLYAEGLTPILTHPERNATLQSDADHSRLEEWMRAGVLLQVTAGSITGGMGRKAEKLAHELLAKRWVNFVATDAHNLTSRPPKMREAYDLVANRYGSEMARGIFVTNPLSVFLGKPMPQQPPRAGIDEPPRWWRRLGGS